MTLQLEPITLDGWPFRILGIAYGQGPRLQLEVLYSKHDRTPNPTQLRTAWKSRQDRRGVPLLVVILHEEKAHVCGPSGEDPTVYPGLDPGQVERICQEALEQPSRQAALRALRDSLGALEEDGLPGLRNAGFLASHELTRGVPTRPDWTQAGDRSRGILGHTGKELLGSLGFTVEPLDKITAILKTGDRKTAIAVLLNERETPESGSQRIPGALSPVSYALSRADDQNLDWVVLLNGRKIRLYPVKMGVGVGRRGRTETFLECHTGLIPDDQAAYLWLLFSADALSRDGSLTSILDDSRDFAGDLASRLRERIYDEVIPRLSEGLAEARGLDTPTALELAQTYQMAMRVLFRLLFIAYGEDKDLLPYRFNGLYQKRSLKAKARDLLELADSGGDFGEGNSWWEEVRAIFRAVDQGNPSWGVPAYNGGLFAADPEESPVGAAIEAVSLPDRVFGPVLQKLLLVPTAEGVLGPVDFRSLGVREFGTIYEGLLESELSVAEADLTVETRGKNKGVYRPCKNGEKPMVPVGKVYLHNASGARKSTGSYYTKHFTVEHLLDRALEPAFDDHFARLDKLEELEAAEAFFDFRVADIAMGSGHFLVAAVDRIEARFSGYLAKRPLPEVARELDHLRQAAKEALGDASDSYPEFEDNALLRRQIARRCIYGVDINEVAVQLARLAIWIHTFVPGLPLSLLDRNLVHGNSLVGVGRLSELEDKVRDEGLALFEASAADFVGDADEALARLGRLADATRAEIQAARKAWIEADAATAPAGALCDILTAARIEGTAMPFDFTRWQTEKKRVVGGKAHRQALKVLDSMHPLHFPVVFPEVFLRERAGFDVMLGNPPWAKARLEELKFWGRHKPGIRGLSTTARNEAVAELVRSRPDLVRILEREKALLEGIRHAVRHMPGMNTGHPDYFRAFLQRYIQLIYENGGQLGIVLPGDAFKIRGATKLRGLMAKKFGTARIQLLTNKSWWVFDEVDGRKLIALLSARSSHDSHCLYAFPPEFHSMESWVKDAPAEGMSVYDDWLTDYSSNRVVPTMPSGTNCFETSRVLSVFMRHEPLRSHKTFKLVRVYADFETKRDNRYWKDHGGDADWPVYKGSSFDIWAPETGRNFAWCDGNNILVKAQERRLRSATYSRFPRDWLADIQTHPVLAPRIAFRDVTNRTNTRTFVTALIPGNRVLTQAAPWVLFLNPYEKSRHEAALLGILSSIPLDWWVRRFVEGHVDEEAFMSLRIPEFNPQQRVWHRTIHLAGRLASPDNRFAGWAKEVGVTHGPLDADEKQEMIHELDAVVACLYGLNQKHLIHIFETFHEGWDYHARLDATLGHFRAWKKRAKS